MDARTTAKEMMTIVASALSSELLSDVAFVGGCTTGLFVADVFSLQSIRFADDVDLIVHVFSKASWHQFQDKLRALGFTESMEDDVNCRMRLGVIKVDFMPNNAEILGFSNRWHQCIGS